MRFCLCLLMAAVSVFAADSKSAGHLRGKVKIHPGQSATVETADGQTVALGGDETSQKILQDTRLNGYEIDARGHFTTPGHFQLDPSHTHSMLVRDGGKLKLVTYWCEICAIRSYTPGPCVCCQRETMLDLRDPDEH